MIEMNPATNDIQNRMTDKWVNEANELIMSIMDMQANELALMQYLIGLINPKDDDANDWVVGSKRDVYEFFEANHKGNTTWFRNLLYRLQDSATFTLPDEEVNGATRHKILISTHWGEYIDEFKVKFHPDVTPYLYDLKKYTKTDLEEIRKIRDRKHAIVLYRFLNMNYRQYLALNSNKVRSETQLEALKNPFIDVLTLRKITSSLNNYKRFTDLKNKIVVDAIKVINERTNYTVEFESVKKGQKALGFKFYIKTKQVAPLPDNMKSAKEEEAERQAMFAEAFASPYLQKLVANYLVSSADGDMFNQDLHIRLLKDVYPYYDTIIKSKDSYGVKGEDLLNKHLKHVYGAMLRSSEENKNKSGLPKGFALATYLEKSAKQFVGQLMPIE